MYVLSGGTQESESEWREELESDERTTEICPDTFVRLLLKQGKKYYCIL